MSFHSGPGFNFTYVAHAGFNPWALANDIVVLYPQIYYPPGVGTGQQKGQCWDGKTKNNERGKRTRR